MTLFLMSLILFMTLIPSCSPLVHIVTGSAGYLAKHTISVLLQTETATPTSPIVGLVRSSRVTDERAFYADEPLVTIEDIDTYEAAAPNRLYLLASNFRNVPGHEISQAMENINSLPEQIKRLKPSSVVHVSSMAAVRGPGQKPKNGEVFTAADDYNTVSKLTEGDFGKSYQYSKTEQEIRVKRTCDDLDIPLCSICPSLILGPPVHACNSESLSMLTKWYGGSSCQSRLLVDVRDVAQSIVSGGGKEGRYIVSKEDRTGGEELCRIVNKYGGNAKPGGWEGGKEVRDDSERLGVRLRDLETTIKDTIEGLKLNKQQQVKR